MRLGIPWSVVFMLGPWSACLEESLGPWSPVVDEGRDKTTHSVVKAPTSKFGPWQPALRSRGVSEVSSVAESRSQRGKGSKRQGSMSLGPWGVAHKQEQGPEQRGAGMSEQSLKRARIDMAQACVAEVPHHVRAHNTPITKTSERAKDPKNVKARCSGNGRCMCVEHTKRQRPPCHRRVPAWSIVRLCVALAGMSQEEKGFIFHHMYTEASNGSGDQESGRPGESKSSIRKRWYIGEHKLCFTNFCYMMWTSPSTVREFVCIEAGPDGKRISKRHTGMPKKIAGRGRQGEHVDFFFQEYYQSAGEPLPACSQRTQQHRQGVEEPQGEQDADILQNINGQ